MFADLKNRLGEFSEKVKLLKDKVRIASKADWLIHEEEAKEKARIRRKSPNNQLNDTEAEVRGKELRRTKLEEVLQECRDCILRIGIFSSEFLESKGWRECLRSIVYRKDEGLSQKRNSA